jgi:hypothetical protein
MHGKLAKNKVTTITIVEVRPLCSPEAYAVHSEAAHGVYAGAASQLKIAVGRVANLFCGAPLLRTI